MATPSEKLAESLEVLKDLQDAGQVAIPSNQLSRTHRERLIKGGFIEEVIRGWYIPTRPGETAGESTAWYASFWGFCGQYLTERLGDDWCLSPEQSVMLHTGDKTVPIQLLIRSLKARNQITTLLHGTSLFEVRTQLPDEKEIITNDDGVRIYSLASGLIACAEDFYVRQPTNARAALAMFRDASEILPRLLAGGHSTIAGRLAGAFRNIGRTRIADDILETMRTAGYNVWEKDPFEVKSPIKIRNREISPYVNRIRLMWESMREHVIQNFPESSGLPKDIDAYMKQVADNYANDAYNSLSIEGYRVTHALIERVRRGDWQPEKNEEDRNQRDAMAARGYWQAYQAVKESVLVVLKGGNAGEVADDNHGTWYREMFSPSVTAGIVRPEDLAGYRNQRVHIRRSMHVPPNTEAIRDLMPAFFELLKEEENAAVRVVLGHFIFVYIHPYIDGNGRIGRFLMNVMLASGGYPWTVVPVEQREEYMAALEQASVHQNIVPFAQLLGKLAQGNLKSK